MSFIPNIGILKNNDVEGPKTLELLTNKCPKCSAATSLIMMYKKDRYSQDNFTYSAIKIQCIRCKWKVSGNYKWKSPNT